MKELRICFIGDSFVNGTGDPTCLGWTGRLCADANLQGHEITYYNLGIRRETSRDIAQRWLAEVTPRLLPEHDNRIVFSFGVNDTTIEDGNERVPLEETLSHTRAILRTALQRFPTLMIGPPPVLEEQQNARIARLSKEMAHVCERVHVPYLEVFTQLLHNPVWRHELSSNDSYHPRAAGYEVLARIIQQWHAWQSWFV